MPEVPAFPPRLTDAAAGPVAGGAGESVFTPGAELSARVVESLDATHVTVQVRGRMLVAESATPLVPGSVVKIAIAAVGDQITARLVPPEAQTAAQAAAPADVRQAAAQALVQAAFADAGAPLDPVRLRVAVAAVTAVMQAVAAEGDVGFGAGVSVSTGVGTSPPPAGRSGGAVPSAPAALPLPVVATDSDDTATTLTAIAPQRFAAAHAALARIGLPVTPALEALALRAGTPALPAPAFAVETVRALVTEAVRQGVLPTAAPALPAAGMPSGPEPAPGVVPEGDAGRSAAASRNLSPPPVVIQGPVGAAGVAPFPGNSGPGAPALPGPLPLASGSVSAPASTDIAAFPVGVGQASPSSSSSSSSSSGLPRQVAVGLPVLTGIAGAPPVPGQVPVTQAGPADAPSPPPRPVVPMGDPGPASAAVTTRPTSAPPFVAPAPVVPVPIPPVQATAAGRPVAARAALAALAAYRAEGATVSAPGTPGGTVSAAVRVPLAAMPVMGAVVPTIAWRTVLADPLPDAVRDGAPAVQRALALAGVRIAPTEADPSALRPGPSLLHHLAAAAAEIDEAAVRSSSAAASLAPVAEAVVGAVREQAAATVFHDDRLRDYDRVLPLPLAADGQPVPARLAVARRNQPGGGTATYLRVDTELSELGPVSVRLSGLDGGAMAITLMADGPAARALSAALPALAADLRAAGLAAGLRVVDGSGNECGGASSTGDAP